MKHFLEMGQKIRLAGIGIFKVGFSAISVTDPDNCTASTITSRRILFQPEPLVKVFLLENAQINFAFCSLIRNFAGKSMFMHWKLVILFLLLATAATAQNRDHQMMATVDSVLATRYYKTSYDTNYVVRPDGRLTLKVRLNQSGDDFNVRGDKDGVRSKADLSTNHKTTVSIGASYRGISASLAINPAKMSGIYKDYELNLAYYSSRLSLDASYHRSTTLSGDTQRGDNVGYLAAGDVKMTMVNLAGYYVFNHRRFSYPAAFTQSYIQRCSAGSWLAGISYQGGSIETTAELKKRMPDAPDLDIHIGLLGLGGGYAYSWVLGGRWLLHFSMLPTVVVYNHNYMTVNGVRKDAPHLGLSMIFNERAAVVCNISPRYFAGATLTMSNSIFDNDVMVNQNKWRAQAFIGMRL